MMTVPTIQLKADRFEQEAARRKWFTKQQIADGIGISRPNLSKLLNPDERKRQSPGETFIAAVLYTFPDARFEDFFEVTAQTPLRRAA